MIVDRKPYYINTGIKVRKSEWKMGIIVNRPDSDTLQQRLNLIYKRIEDELNADISVGKSIDVREIRRRAWTFDEDTSSSLLDWIDEQIPLLNVREVTKKHYVTLMARLREYDGIRRWSDLTAENICKWDAWLHELTRPQSEAERLAKKEKESIGDGSVWNYHKCFKAMLNRAVLFDRITQNPYDRLRGQFKRGDRERVDFLTDEEMEAFCSLHPVFGSKMGMARDMFVVQLYTGLSYTDMQQFDINDYKMIDDVWKNTGERIKTGVAYVSQLLPPVVEVLEKYNWQIPQMDNADYNRCLKLLGEACGIERPLHSHMARHTFATFMLRHGVAIEHVSKMLGHTNITQTQRYAKVLAKDVHDDFDKIAKKLKSKK